MKVKEQTPDLLGEVATEAPPAQLPAAPKTAKGKTVAKVEPNKALSDEGASEVAMLLRAVTDPNVDVQKAQAIEGMIERRRAALAKAAFVKAYIALQSDLPEIDQDGKIVAEGVSRRSGKAYSQKSSYSTFPNLYRMVKPKLRAHGFGFLCAPDVGKDGVGIIMHGTLMHDAGHEFSGLLPLKLETSGSKNDLQGVGSSLSYGRRYLLITLCQIISRAPQDKDINGATPEDVKSEDEVDDNKITMEQAIQLREKIEASGLTAERFCTKYRIKSPSDLPAADFNAAIAACDNFKQQAQGG